MRDSKGERTGGEVLVDQLLLHGVEHIFCVPGESYIAALDALCGTSIAITVCRQEGGASMMAEAAGKITGRPGICFVTRGPGATNAASGLHVARQDSTPMILFVGQIGRDIREREAFQELDYRAVFGTMAKWVTEIDDPARIPELVSRAFHTATSGRPGPVVIALPEDMLTERTVTADAPAFEPIETAPRLGDIDRLRELLAQAARPIVLLGGSRWSEAATAAVARFAERFALPVATTFRRTHLFDPEHPSYAGELGNGPNPKLVERVKSADLVLLVGGRFGELQSQRYTILEVPAPRQKLVHVHPGAEELGRVYRPHLAIHSTPSSFAAALETLSVPNALPWRDQTLTAHADYLAWTQMPTAVPGPLNPGHIIVSLRDRLPADAVICNGAGNFSLWVHRFYRYRRFGTQLAPVAGSMGYGVPAAIAMKRLAPERTVIAFAGDGDFLMTGQEFATAVQYQLPIIVIIIDNGMYGTIRMHQEREYPGRVIGTQLNNPDFATYARAFGGFGATVAKTAEFKQAFDEAERSEKPSIIHLKLDPQAITPLTTLEAIREKAVAERTSS